MLLPGAAALPEASVFRATGLFCQQGLIFQIAEECPCLNPRSLSQDIHEPHLRRVDEVKEFGGETSTKPPHLGV